MVRWTGKGLCSSDPEALTALVLLLPPGPADGIPVPVLA